MSTALILHPNPALQDPYGVITPSQIHEYARMAEAFVDGWVWRNGGNWWERPPYWLLREYVDGIADIPEMTASQIALHYCQPPRNSFINDGISSPYFPDFFHPVI